MRSLRVQLLASHLSIVVLLVAVMVGSILNFLHLGRSIDRIFRDNYKSVLAAQSMKEALEHQNSAAALFLAGHTAKARAMSREHAGRFEAAYRTAAGNVTAPGEQAIVDDIAGRFAASQREMDRLLASQPPLDRARARELYAGSLEPGFAALERRAQDLVDLNQEAILRADRAAKSDARRAARTSIAVTLAAFALAIFFAFRTIRASLTPLLLLARQAEEIGAGHLDQPVDLHRADEVGALAAAFNRMRERLKEARRNEELRLHRAQRMSDEALESLYDPIVVTDAAGAVVHLNPAAEGLFGPASQANGRFIAEVASDPRIVHAVERAVRQAAVSAGEEEADFIPLLSGEAERTYRLRATPIHDDDGSVLGAVAVLEDVTHLRQLDRLKNEFIGVASHELRTPVTSLLLAVQLMEGGVAGPLTPEQTELVAAQRQDLERLQRMMRDLLDVTRLEAGAEPPRFRIVHAKDLLAAAAESVSAQAEAKGIALDVRGPADEADVRADKTQMARVLVNLMSNAVRHTPEGGRVTLSACKEAETVVFRVADTGSGIPAEYLPRIFERFVQTPGATRGGAGLGLSIAQTIVKAHQGTIEAESEVGVGSVFTVKLPCAAAHRGGKEQGDGAHLDHRR